MKTCLHPGLVAFGTVLALASPAASAQAQELAGPERLAQADIGSFVDRHGRRVYFDRRTNRIIAVEEPQPLRDLIERVLPPLISPPPGQQVDTFPPAPEPAPQTGTTALPVPAPDTIQRAPLDTAANTGQPERIRRLDEVLAERNPAPEPETPAPQANSPGGTETAAVLPARKPAAPTRGTVIAKLQILLDRQGYSPGVIDGEMGSNVRKAVAIARWQTGFDYNPADEAAIDAALARTGGEAFARYVISAQDVAGPFAETIPADYAEKAKMPAMSFTSPREMLAERFHMSETYLEALNPDVNFWLAGTTIRVAAVGANIETPVARIEADKTAEQVRAYDAAGQLVGAWPATIGSSDTPSPSGSVQVERVAFDPNYTYNPKVNFVQGENRSVLTIPPGPNGPVGSIWIALSKPTYGIHGTPEPDRIGKNNSHGCVRLTNWDAAELARLVSKGVTVGFLD